MEDAKTARWDSDPVVIGAMVLDIHAASYISPSPRTTVPGKVTFALGGVARNVAECMFKLGTKPYIVSAVGLDMAGNLLLEYWNSVGLSTSGIRRCQDISTPVTCNIFDTFHELAAAVASVEAIERFLTPKWISQFVSHISSAPILMIDANLSPATLEVCCQVGAESSVPIWFEPVSVAKCGRIASIVKYVTFASPNEDELVAMAKALSSENGLRLKEKNSELRRTPQSLFQMLRPAILVLLEQGIKMVVATLGANGVLLCCRRPREALRISLKRTRNCLLSQQLCDAVSSSCPSGKLSGYLEAPLEDGLLLSCIHFPAAPASAVRLTGAGDCLVGGTIASLCSGLDVMQSLSAGIAVAKAAVEAEPNVPSQFDLASISGDAGWVYSSAKAMVHQSML